MPDFDGVLWQIPSEDITSMHPLVPDITDPATIGPEHTSSPAGEAAEPSSLWQEAGSYVLRAEALSAVEAYRDRMYDLLGPLFRYRAGGGRHNAR